MLALEQHVVGLFLAVIVQHQQPAARLAEADAVTGLALISMLFNATFGE